MTDALLVMDVQEGIAERFGDGEAVDRAADAVTAARAHGVQVLFVRVAFRAGFPEVSPANRSFSARSLATSNSSARTLARS